MDDRFLDQLDASNALEHVDKRVLREIFRGLMSEQENTMQAVLREVQQELREMSACGKAGDLWQTTTALVEEADLKKVQGAGLFEVPRKLNEHRERTAHREHMEFTSLSPQSDNQYCAGTAFLNCRYSDMRDLLEQEYEAKLSFKDGRIVAVPYRMCFAPWVVQKEELLEKIADQYGVTRPLIYAPMARRAVYIFLDASSFAPADLHDAEVDFQYEKNQLQETILSGKVPVWNVELETDMPRPRESTELVTPFGDITSKRYDVPAKDNQFVLVVGGGWDAERHGDRLWVNIDDDAEAVSFHRITLHEVSDLAFQYAEYIFRNEFNNSVLQVDRIRTMGDVSQVLNRFRAVGLEYTGAEMTLGTRTSIPVYDQARAYYRSSKDASLRGRRTACYVDLRPTQPEDRFFEDAVSYAIAYLNRAYPEFLWVAV